MAKSKTAKLPKRILGVKVPKRLRTGPFAAMLLSPVGQGVMSEIIYHIGESLTKRASDSRLADDLRKRMGLVGAQASGQIGRQSSLLQHAIGGAVDHFVSTMRQGRSSATDGLYADTASTDAISGEKDARLAH